MLKMTLAAMALTVCASTHATSKPKEVAMPFGIAIGKTTCAEAGKLLGRRGSRLSNGDYFVQAGFPERHYPAAESIVAQCSSSDKPVLWLKVEVDEGVSGGGPRNFEVIKALYDKYSAEGTGAAPGHGRYALLNDMTFEDATGATVIEFHHYWGGKFSVTYMNRATKMRFDVLKKEALALEKSKADAAAAVAPATRF